MNSMARLLILPILFIGLNNPLTAQSLTLDSCYAMVANNYPLIRQYDLIEKAREYNLSNASKAYLPQVSVSAIAGYLFSSNQNEAKVIGIGQLNQAIWDGGAIKAQKQLIKAQAESEKANLDVSMYEVRSRVNQIFFGILLIDEQLLLIEQHEKMLGNNAARISKLNENGMALQTDLDEISVEQHKLNQKRTEYQYTREGYIRMLSLLLGKDLDEGTKLTKPVVPDVSPDLELNRPELKAFQAQRTFLKAEDARRKVDMMPKLGIMGVGVMMEPGMALGPTTLSSLGVIGFNASWNISGLYRNNNMKMLNATSLQKVDVQQSNFVFNTNLQTAQTQANIQKQKAILNEDIAIVNLRRRIRDGYQVKYDNGTASLLDLLDATERENEAQTQMKLHEMQLLMTYYDYKNQTGNQ